MAPLSEEEENYVRLVLLLKGVSPRAVRTYFDREFPPSDLPSTLIKIYNTLDELKLRNILNKTQWSLLFPRNGVPDSNTFSVTLMICLISNWAPVTPPINGFDSLPDSAETTPGADLARIKWYRNKVLHHDSNKLDTVDFNKAWSDISDSVRRLGGQAMYEECQELKVKILDNSDQKVLLEIKQSKKEIKESRQTMDSSKTEELEKLEDKLGQLQTTLQTEYSEVTERLKDNIPWNSREKMLSIIGGTIPVGAYIKADSIRRTAFEAKSTTIKDDVEISGYKGAKNEEFYQLKIVCDNFVVDCIIDNRLKHKCRKSVFEFQELTEEMIQWSETLSYLNKKVEEKFLSIVETKNSCLCQYLLNNISDNAIETHILVNALHSSIEKDDVDTAKFIGWQIARNFLTSLNVHVYDIWLASLCSCSSLKKKHFSWFCSTDVTIIIMVPHLIKKIVNNFSGLSIKQVIYHCEVFKEAEAISEEKAKLLERDRNIQCHVPGPLAETLFNNHRRLSLVCPSEIKSMGFRDFPTKPTFLNCSCIQLYCHVKGAIPIGEKHFPGKLQGIPTDVIEGFPRFSSKHIRIGDSVTNTRVKGSLGGFCLFYGRESFLTCAHTMMDWDTLLSVELKHHMQQESVHVYTGDKILDETLLCGKVVNHSFTHDSPKEISTDVALVEIGNDISISADDCVNTKGNRPLHFSELGLKSRYLQDGYIRSPHALPGQNVGVVCAGAVSGLNGSVSLISKVPKRVLAREDLQSVSTNLETRSMEYLQTQVNMPVHMQVNAIIYESRKEEAESDRTVRFYNQLAVHNIPFQQGDSGACVYITNGYTETGCLGMAIADFPGGGCIVTPMAKLLEKLGLI